jgi:hypothetical protein
MNARKGGSRSQARTLRAERLGLFLVCECPCGETHYYPWAPWPIINSGARLPMCKPGAKLHQPPGWIFLCYDEAQP